MIALGILAVFLTCAVSLAPLADGLMALRSIAKADTKGVKYQLKVTVHLKVHHRKVQFQVWIKWMWRSQKIYRKLKHSYAQKWRVV